MNKQLWLRDQIKRKELYIARVKAVVVQLRGDLAKAMRRTAYWRGQVTKWERKIRAREELIAAHVREILMLKARVEGYQAKVLQMQADTLAAERINAEAGVGR